MRPMFCATGMVGLFGFVAFFFFSTPSWSGEQLCTFCAKSAVSEEYTQPEESPRTQGAVMTGQRFCTFCGKPAGTEEHEESAVVEGQEEAAEHGGGQSPADGFTIHVMAPHMMADGTVGGPFHHYCKGISDTVLQCLLFESTDPKAKLVAVEYFIAKSVSRQLPRIVWGRNFHDHKVEIATGRVQILDMAPDQAKAVAEVAAKTDGVIFHLWHKDQTIPDGRVSIPQSLGHIWFQPE